MRSVCLDRGRLLTVIGLAMFVTGSAAVVASNGLLLSRDLIFVWLMAGLLAVSLADVGGFMRGVVTDWLPFFGALFLYDVLRGVAGDEIFTPHVLPQIRVDEFLFGGGVPTVDLQQQFFTPGALAAWDYAAWAVYLTHFFAVPVIAAVLWRRQRERFLRFRNLVLGLTAAAFVTYVLFPAVPPWLASDQGAIGEVHRTVGAVWSGLGVTPAAGIWERGSSFANEVAAVPSLHAAYPVVIMLFFWSAGSRIRAICIAYAVAMSLTLVYTGEHYVSDVLLGWLYAGAVYAGLGRLSAVRARRRVPRGAAPAIGPLLKPAEVSLLEPAEAPLLEHA